MSVMSEDEIRTLIAEHGKQLVNIVWSIGVGTNPRAAALRVDEKADRIKELAKLLVIHEEKRMMNTR